MKNAILSAAIVATGLFGFAVAQQGGPPEGEGGRPPGPRRPMGPPPIIAVLDADKNGELSAQEIANASVALLTLDVNKDGMLDRDEMFPPPPDGKNPPKKGDHILKMDKDGDGSVSLAEFLAGPTEAFNKIDKNSDGKIDADEAAAAPPPPPPHGPPPHAGQGAGHPDGPPPGGPGAEGGRRRGGRGGRGPG